MDVTVAIPTLNGGEQLEQTLAAVRRQQLDEGMSIELLVCDSGSCDGSVASARRHGAEVLEIAPKRFSHGGTRNLLMRHAQGEYVAFLTQDAVPADERWLRRLLEGFALTECVGLVFGPYRPRPDASPMVRRELTEWFRSLSADGSPRIDRLEPAERAIEARALLGARGFFTDANGCVARAAWEAVPFRQVRYAEDHLLALDMMRAGYAKAFIPDAAVIHSHEYSIWNWLRRSFDEAQAINDVYGYAPPLRFGQAALNVWGSVGADWRCAHAAQPVRPGLASTALLARSLGHHLPRAAGTLLGGRADRLPGTLARHLSLDASQRRAGRESTTPAGGRQV